MMPLEKLRDLFDGPDKKSHEYFEILTNDFLTRHHHPLAEAEKDKMIDAARDGKNMAANRRLEMQGITDATQTFGSMQIGLAALGPAAQAFASDMNQTGVPMSDMTKSFASLTPRTAEVIKKILESSTTPSLQSLANIACAPSSEVIRSV